MTYEAEEDTLLVFFTYPIWQQTAYSKQTAAVVFGQDAQATRAAAVY